MLFLDYSKDSTPFRMQSEAVKCLQLFAESTFCTRINKCTKITNHAHRKTLMPEDIQLLSTVNSEDNDETLAEAIQDAKNIRKNVARFF